MQRMTFNNLKVITLIYCNYLLIFLVLYYLYCNFSIIIVFLKSNSNIKRVCDLLVF